MDEVGRQGPHAVAVIIIAAEEMIMDMVEEETITRLTTIIHHHEEITTMHRRIEDKMTMDTAEEEMNSMEVVEEGAEMIITMKSILVVGLEGAMADLLLPTTNMVRVEVPRLDQDHLNQSSGTWRIR